MSDALGRSDGLVGRDGPAADVAELPLGMTVSNVVSVRREESARVAVELSEAQLAQLALQFAAAVAQPQAVERPLLGELAGVWMERIRPVRVKPQNEERLLQHLVPLFLEDESTLTASMVEDLLVVLRRTLSPSTCNKVLATGRRVVALAMADRRWTQPNPFALVRRRKEVPPAYQLLTLAELSRVQEHLTPSRRRMFRVALHLGLRSGELLALQKSDVDFEAGVVHIHRSHGRNVTKTGRDRDVPLHPAVAGDLMEAAQASTTELLFPAEDGGRQRDDTKLTRVLRTAMASAGVGLLGVVYKCRRCGEVRDTEDKQVQRVDCPRCEATMWPVPRVRGTRWYDLRHLCATFHHEAKADPLCVALALGHSVRDTTGRIYTHPTPERMRAELSRWKLPG